MKGSKLFEERIKAYLDRRAFTDQQFAEKYANPDKSIEKCCEYILGEVSESGQGGYDDDEIYGMAVHYYDEENVEIKPNKVDRVVVDTHVELTEEEKAEVRKKAIEDYQRQVVEGMKKKLTPKPQPKEEQPQLELF